MDDDPVVQVVRASMKVLASEFGLKTVDESYCGVGTGQLGSELEVASSTVGLFNGRYYVVDLRTDGTMYYNYQLANQQWSGESYLDNESVIGKKATQAAIAADPNGVPMLFFIGTDGAIYMRDLEPDNSGGASQGEPSDAPWGVQVATGLTARNMALTHEADGRLEVFYAGTSATESHYDAPNGELTAGIFHSHMDDNGYWGQFMVGAASHHDAKQIAAVPNQDGRLGLFYIRKAQDPAVDGAVYYVSQSAPNSDSWSAPVALGGVVKQLTAGIDTDGQFHVFGFGTDDCAYRNDQLAPNGGWSGWNWVGICGSQMVLAPDSWGILTLFVLRSDNHIIYYTQTGNQWSGGDWLGGPARHIAVAEQSRVIFTGTNGALYENHKDPYRWAGNTLLYSAPTESQTRTQAALYLNTSTRFDDGADWIWGYGKANCAPGYRIVGLSESGGIGQTAECMGPNPDLFSGQVADTLSWSGHDERRYARTVGTSTDWDWGFVKHECAYGQYVSGIAEGAVPIENNNDFYAIQCAYAVPEGGWSEASCTTREFKTPNQVGVGVSQDDRATTYDGNWDEGALKAQCDVDQHLAGVSISLTTKQIHRLLCCSNNP
jgi:hypothetical protein